MIRNRGFLWLSCESNEARGGFVERLCRWHRSKPPQPHPHQDRFASPFSFARSPNSEVDVDRSRNGDAVVGDDEGGGGDEKEEDGLEVEQVLAKELMEDIAKQKSLNVTALIVADEESLTTTRFSAMW